MTNPYAVPATAGESGVYSPGAKRIRGGFLYRVIQFESPFSATLIYDGWWFRQRISIDENNVWRKISWRTIHRTAEFRLPLAVDPAEPACRLEIDFSRGLWIRRFRIWVDDIVTYDEIN